MKFSDRFSSLMEALVAVFLVLTGDYVLGGFFVSLALLSLPSSNEAESSRGAEKFLGRIDVKPEFWRRTMGMTLVPLGFLTLGAALFLALTPFPNILLEFGKGALTTIFVVLFFMLTRLGWLLFRGRNLVQEFRSRKKI